MTPIFVFGSLIGPNGPCTPDGQIISDLPDDAIQSGHSYSFEGDFQWLPPGTTCRLYEQTGSEDGILLAEETYPGIGGYLWVVVLSLLPIPIAWWRFQRRQKQASSAEAPSGA